MICVDCGGDFDPAETIDCKHYRALCVQRLRAALSERDARVAKMEGALRKLNIHPLCVDGAPCRYHIGLGAMPLEAEVCETVRAALTPQAPTTTPVADAGAPTALCRYCGQSESNHHDGVGAARDCTFTPIKPYTPPTLSAETMQRGEEIMQRLVDRAAPAVDEQAAVERVVEAVEDMIVVCGFPCGNPRKCGNCQAVARALADLNELRSRARAEEGEG